MSKPKVPGIEDFDGPAGGWSALGSVARALKDQMAVGRETSALRKVNQPAGFDCPGCAWPDPKHTSSFEFCENGAKAVAWEATGKRATPALFAENTVSQLWSWTDHALEDAGRLTEPMAYDAGSDRYLPIGWDDAFARIGTALRALPDPDMAEFYTSGRTSNEAAFLYQLMVREYGTNNFPDCSNMCHEATSVGLPASIGVGKGTVTLDDFALCDALFSFGHNPGTNHPRMLSTLREVSKRGVPIVAVNPLRERGLERFTSPQHPGEMLTNTATPIAQTYYQVKIGGDIALLKGMMKWLVANNALDHDFIAEGYAFRDQGWYQRTVASPGGWWSEPYLNQTAGGVWMVTYNMPLRDPGRGARTRGMVSLDLPLANLTGMVDSLAHLPGWRVSLVAPAGTPQDFAQHIVESTKKWAGVVKASGAKVD